MQKKHKYGTYDEPAKGLLWILITHRHFAVSIWSTGRINYTCFPPLPIRNQAKLLAQMCTPLTDFSDTLETTREFVLCFYGRLYLTCSCRQTFGHRGDRMWPIHLSCARLSVRPTNANILTASLPRWLIRHPASCNALATRPAGPNQRGFIICLQAKLRFRL